MKLEIVGSVFALLLSVFLGVENVPVPNQVFSNANHANNEYLQNQEAKNLVWDKIAHHNKPMSSLQSQSAWLGCLCDEPPFFEKAPNAQLPLASVTKIMTAYLALRELGPDYSVNVSQEAVATEGIAGDLQAGEVLTIKDLIVMMMTYSSNDAAMAVAEALGRAYGSPRLASSSGEAGSSHFSDAIARTVWLMNEEARLLGMWYTMFQNPTGLDFKNGPSNFSTARDMVLLLQATRAQPLLWDLARIDEPRVISQNGIAHDLLNLNPFRDFPHYVGGKTGTTDYAGENLVMLFERPLGKLHALILFGAPPGQREIEAKKLLDWINAF